MQELAIMLMSALPNFAGFILLAWSNNRTIDRLFREINRNEKDIDRNFNRITALETRVTGFEAGLERLRLTVQDMLMMLHGFAHDDKKPVNVSGNPESDSSSNPL